MQPACDYRHYHMSPGQWCILWGQGIVIYGTFIYTFYRSSVLFLLAFPLSLFYPEFKRKELLEQQKMEFAREFKEGILILSASLSAGYSIENAFSASLNELCTLYGKEGMISREFQYMAKRISMKDSPEQVFLDLAERSGQEDVENFAQIFSAAKRSGGQLVTVISHTAGIIRDKAQIREEIFTLTAAKQFEQKIMNLIPFFIVFYINATSPGFFDLMYDTGFGRVIMTICLLVYLFSFWLAKRLLRIEI